MEKPPSGRAPLDDTVPLAAVIEASQNVQSHTVSGGREGSSVCPRPGSRRPRRDRPGRLKACASSVLEVESKFAWDGSLLRAAVLVPLNLGRDCATAPALRGFRVQQNP